MHHHARALDIGRDFLRLDRLDHVVDTADCKTTQFLDRVATNFHHNRIQQNSAPYFMARC